MLGFAGIRCRRRAQLCEYTTSNLHKRAIREGQAFSGPKRVVGNGLWKLDFRGPDGKISLYR